MSLTLLVVINVVFGCLVLAIGFAIGIWLSNSTRSASPAPVPGPPTSNEAEVSTALHHARMAYTSLLRLADNVSGNILAHSTKVEAISHELRAADQSPPNAQELLATAPERLLAANLELQQQLIAAKQEIVSLATTLRVRESEARTDPLTGLLNRRAFDEEIKRHHNIGQRKNIHFALLLLDIDRFKFINDSHGHQVGDEVMRQAANIIASHLREMDYAFRYGGEEFAVLLPATDSAAASAVAERIRQAFEQTPIATRSGSLNVTLSVGLTSAVAGDEVSKIIRRADDALYRAKHAGRNCVRFHTGTQIVHGGGSDTPAEATAPTVPEPDSAVASRTATLNGELTRQICHSRKLNQPISIVAVRVDTDRPATAPGLKILLGKTLQAVMAIAQEKLPPNCFAAPIDAAEFVVLLPGYHQAAAQRWSQEHLDTALTSRPGNGSEIEVRWEACELCPLETAEQLLHRTRKQLLAATVVMN